MIVAVESGVTACRCRCTTSSSMAPASYSSCTAPVSSCHSRCSAGRRSMTVAIVIAWSSCSTIAAETSASCSIQKTLLGRRRRVDRYHLGADRPQREVEERPLVAGTGHDRDPVAEADALREQALGEGEHLVAELGGGHVPPLVLLVLAAEGDVQGVVLGTLEDDVGQTAHRRCQRQRRVVVLAQTPLPAPVGTPLQRRESYPTGRKGGRGSGNERFARPHWSATENARTRGRVGQKSLRFRRFRARNLH
jgi:hypothetical protein